MKHTVQRRDFEGGRTCYVIRVKSRMGGFVVKGSGSPVESIRHLAAVYAYVSGGVRQFFQKNE